jgi:2'-5' RNA ligase
MAASVAPGEGSHPTAGSPSEVYRFGLFVIPLPEPLRSQVASLRRRFDVASAETAPPHITVTGPLADVPNDIARADLGAALSECAPFELSIGPAAAFPDSPVVYLAVAPAAPVLEIRAVAHASGLFRTDLPHTDDFLPHVTIREWPGDEGEDNEAVIDAVDRLVPRTTITVEAVELWRPDGAGWFERVDHVRLVGR